MKSKISAYQSVSNMKKQENLSFQVFDSISKYIKDGINKDYNRLTRQKMLAQGNYLTMTALEHLSANIADEIMQPVENILKGIIQLFQKEIENEFSQNFNDALNALEELKKMTK